MTELLVILIGTVLVNNFVLARFLGLCPFLGSTLRLDGALGMSLATTFVLTLASVVSYLVEHWLLIPLDAQHLRLIAFILIIAGTVQGTETLMRHFSPLLYQVLGIYLPLITTNCAVLGVALLNSRSSHSFIESLFFGLGAGLGFTLAMLLFAGLRERIADNDVPAPFQGAAIGLITAGLMSLGFLGFTGLLR